MKIDVILEHDAIMPTRAHPWDAGLDLYSREHTTIDAGDKHCFDTGVHVAIPRGYVGFIMSKSGLDRNQDLTCTGTIDADYTGSIGVTLRNNNNHINVVIPKGRKIGQLVILPIIVPELNEVTEFEKTDRGNGGFGSTGAF